MKSSASRAAANAPPMLQNTATRLDERSGVKACRPSSSAATAMRAPPPFVVGGALMAVAALLEGLQAFTPDRSSNLVAVFCSIGGALAAALLAELFIRARRRRTGVASKLEEK